MVRLTPSAHLRGVSEDGVNRGAPLSKQVLPARTRQPPSRRPANEEAARLASGIFPPRAHGSCSTPCGRRSSDPGQPPTCTPGRWPASRRGFNLLKPMVWDSGPFPVKPFIYREEGRCRCFQPLSRPRAARRREGPRAPSSPTGTNARGSRPCRALGPGQASQGAPLRLGPQGEPGGGRVRAWGNLATPSSPIRTHFSREM